MKHLGTSLKLIRQFHRLKQKELAAKLDISTSHLSEIESEQKSPSLELLERYSRTFDLPASSIMIFAEMQKDSAKLEYRIADKAVKMLDWIAMVGSEVESK